MSKDPAASRSGSNKTVPDPQFRPLYWAGGTGFGHEGGLFGGLSHCKPPRAMEVAQPGNAGSEGRTRGSGQGGTISQATGKKPSKNPLGSLEAPPERLIQVTKTTWKGSLLL